jgi:CheY-like chemotaxis protein/signal recognition particle receptor subunit beta
MALFNHATKEVTAKLVYYGPGLCGKTTNLQWVHDNLTFRSKGKLVSLATQTDRTLFFDFLPVELGTIRGMRTRMQIYTVPGQVFYEATRRMVLKGCDAVVFVADSQAAMLDANFESLQSLRRNLLANEIDPSIPMVIQYNKRDLPTALPISVLNARLNPRNVPYFESVASQGQGVEDTLRGITKALFKWLSDYYGGSEREATPARATPAPPEATPSVQPTPPPAPAPPAREAAKPAVRPSGATPAARSGPEARPAAPAKPSKPAPRPPLRAGAPAAAPPARTTPPAPPKPASPPAQRVESKPPAPPAESRPVEPQPLPETPSAPPPASHDASAEIDAGDQIPPTIRIRPRRVVIPSQPPAPPKPEPVPQPAPPPPPEPQPEPVAQPAPPPPPEPKPEPVAQPTPPPPPASSEPAETALEAARRMGLLSSEPEPASTPERPHEPVPSAPVPPSLPEPGPDDEPAPTISIKGPTKSGDLSAKGAPPSAPSQAVFRESAAGDPAPRGDDLREDQWLYLLEGRQRGPVDVEDLVDLVLTSIPEDTKVWHPGLDGWVRANQVRAIAAEIPPPLPVPGAVRGVAGDEDMPDFDTVPHQFRTALIADEDEAFRKYLAMPLAAQGFTIQEAADGSAAWQLAVQHRPWLILADVSMPEVDGFEFCRRVRSHPLLSHTPLLFISGTDKYKERYRALQIGADDFLSKQMPIRELLMRIQLLLTKYSDLGAEQEQPGVPAGDAQGIFQGRIEVFGAPALLQMCAQGRLTGIFTALAEDEANSAAVMGFREGEVISATVGTASGLEAAYAFLGWGQGSFKFTPGEPGEGEPLAQSVEHLLLEGCRLLDESQRGDGEEGALA